MRFIPDEGDNHAVEVEEEHHQMETELDERFLIKSAGAPGMLRDYHTFLWTFSFLKISVASSRC